MAFFYKAIVPILKGDVLELLIKHKTTQGHMNVYKYQLDKYILFLNRIYSSENKTLAFVLNIASGYH